MLIYSFITDYQAFSLRYKDNTTRDKNETKVGKQSANLGKNNEPIQNRLSFLIDCKSVILHHLAILSFPMVRPAWDNWWLLVDIADVYGACRTLCHHHGGGHGVQDDGQAGAAGRAETFPPFGRVDCPLLVVPSGRHGHGRQREQLVLPGLPIVHTELHRFVHP